MGDESPLWQLPRTGSAVASDVSVPLADVVWWSENRIAVLSQSGSIYAIDKAGRLGLVTQIPVTQVPVDNVREAAQALDVEAGGTLLAVVEGRIWRVTPDGIASPLTPEIVAQINAPVRDYFVSDVESLPDGGFLFTQGLVIRRSLPDGQRIVVAGNGADGRARAGLPTQSPLQDPKHVAALPGGGFVFEDSGTIWRVDPGGSMRRIAGCPNCDPNYTPRSGRPAASVSIDQVDNLLPLDDGDVAFLSGDGVYEIKAGRLHQVARGAPFTAHSSPPPLWAGGDARHVSLIDGVALDRTPAGEWLISTYDGLVLLTRRAAASPRLAVAVLTSTLASIWHREIRVSATRPASVRIRVRAGRRIVETLEGTIAAGVTRLQLKRRIPSGIADLELRAAAPDGAVASHRLRVLGTRVLPLHVATRSLVADELLYSNDAIVTARRCRSQGPARAMCTIVGGDEHTSFSVRTSVTLRRDGWLWGTQRGQHFRLELR